MILKKSLIHLLVYSIILGFIYPLIITVFAQIILKQKANGSIIESKSKIIGSKLIGQNFTSDKYFWPRPSAINYDPKSSSGTNLALSNPHFQESLKTTIKKYVVENNSDIPIELVTSSASGLDPEISLKSAIYQIPRIAKTRTIKEEKLFSLTNQLSIDDLFGEKRVNVLLLNLELDKNEN